MYNGKMQMIFVRHKLEGIEKAKEILYEKVGSQTLLFLSGGKSPKELYETLAREQKLIPGAVALVDERYGKPMHDNSNEKMIKQTGLLDYFIYKHIPWYSILHNNLTRTQTSRNYE